MRKQGIKKSMMMSVISMVILFSIYWTNGSTSIWHISIITVIGILLYGVNKRTYEQAEVSLSNGTTYRRLKPYRIKKRYYLWIVCTTILLRTCITGILNLPSDTANEQRIDEFLKNNPIIESIINIGLLSPIVEEVISRGLLYMVCSGIVILVFNRFFKHAGRKHINKTTGFIFVIISSITFGIPHVIRDGDYQNITPYIISGMVFSVLYVITKTIYVPILLHMLGNTMSTLSSLFKMGLIEINIANGIAVFLLLYPLIGLLVWVWNIKNDDELSKTSSTIDEEIKALGLNRSTATKRQFKAFLMYIKGQMTVK
ncbi:TPA: CPBP family intramembrane metalloprotease [Staphylococcus aureus]|nr:CPBP family intramembrane metalloprotease [Staphylococcus aureus]